MCVLQQQVALKYLFGPLTVFTIRKERFLYQGVEGEKRMDPFIPSFKKISLNRSCTFCLLLVQLSSGVPEVYLRDLV